MKPALYAQVRSPDEFILIHVFNAIVNVRRGALFFPERLIIISKSEWKENVIREIKR